MEDHTPFCSVRKTEIKEHETTESYKMRYRFCVFVSKRTHFCSLNSSHFECPLIVNSKRISLSAIIIIEQRYSDLPFCRVPKSGPFTLYMFSVFE